jgi:hypothetical protein
LKNRSVDGNAVVEDHKEIQSEVFDWIHVAPNKDQWPVFVKAVKEYEAELINELSDHQLLRKGPSKLYS